MKFEFHEESSGAVMAAAQDLLDYLDNSRNLARHMESRSVRWRGCAYQ